MVSRCKMEDHALTSMSIGHIARSPDGLPRETKTMMSIITIMMMMMMMMMMMVIIIMMMMVMMTCKQKNCVQKKN